MRVPKDTAINTLLASRKPLLPAAPPSNFLPMDSFFWVSGRQRRETDRYIDGSIEVCSSLRYFHAEILQAFEGPALFPPYPQFIYVCIYIHTHTHKYMKTFLNFLK